MAFFTDVFNAARNLRLPDLGVSERFSGGGYDPTPRTYQPSSSQRITSYNDYSSGPETLLGAYQNTKPVYQGPVPAGYDEQYYRSTGKTVPLGSAPSGGSTPTSGGTPTGGTSGGTPGGTPTNTVTLTQEQYDALNRANEEGRFEGLTDEQRAAEQLKLESERSAEINDIFSETERLLESAAGNIGSEQDLITQASRPYESQLPLLTQARDEGLAGVDQNISSERLQEKNAINDARRLAQELRLANQQRFGGASSAGEFANSFQGREFQRQFGRIQNTAGQNVSMLRQKAEDIKGQYQTQVQSINLQKEAAIAQAKDIYRQRLSSIDNARISLSQNKAAARLDALRELRNHALAIEDQFRQANLQLAAQAQQANLQLRNAVLAFRENNNAPVDLNAFPTLNVPTIGLQTQSSAGANLPLGSITKRPEEEPALA